MFINDMHRLETASAGAENALEQRLALVERARADVVPVDRQDVEDEDGDRPPDGGAEPGAGGVEVRVPVLIDNDELAIEHQVARPELPDAVHHLEERTLNEPAAAEADMDGVAVLAEKDAAPSRSFRLTRLPCCSA